MRIKKIQLKNGYKRFYDLTIDLGANPKKIVALVGSIPVPGIFSTKEHIFWEIGELFVYGKGNKNSGC